jgi:hypothetical protein
MEETILLKHEIAILEDETMISSDLREHLQRLISKELPILTFNDIDGLNGIELKSGYAFIYILDINLGHKREREGLQAIHRIKEREQGDLSKVIVFTGYPNIKSECLNIGITPEHFIVKSDPSYEANLRLLVSLIKKILNAPGSDPNYLNGNPDDAPDPEFLAGFSPDSPDGEDRLNITPDVNAFASLLTNRHVEPPLSIGLFGDWGSGKSFFMTKLQERIKFLTERTYSADSPYLKKVAPIRFNAWHYMDTNLWASLVQRIFDELADFLGIPRDDEDKLQELFKEFKLTKDQREEAEKRKEEIQQTLRQKQELIDKLEKERQEKIEKLTGVNLSDIIKATLEDEKVKKQLNYAKEKLKLQTVLDSLEDIEAQLEEYNTTGKKLLKIWEEIKLKDAKFWLWLLLIILLPSVVIYVLHYFQKIGEIEKALGEIVTIAAGITACIGKIFLKARPYYDDLNKGISSLESARTRLRLIAEQHREADTRKIELLRHEIDMLSGQQLQAEKEKDRIEAQIRQIEDDIRSIEAGRGLANFIRKRLESQDYQRQLGIISLIRQDFQELSNRMAYKKDGDAKPVERIILFIDDLDRCKPDKVVEVLQAIHLILAFPLFVVVVGVDIRWVSQAIQEEYPVLRGKKVKVTEGFALSTRMSACPSPYDYLEKIFQIPYWLRPMDANGASLLINKMLEGELAQTAGQNVPVQQVLRVEPVPQSSTASTGSVTAIPVAEKITISREELQYIESISPLITTSPRAAKRFVNLLRFIKAHEAGPKTLEETKAAVFLLAVSVDRPADLESFNKWLKTSTSRSLSEHIKTNHQRASEELTGLLSTLEVLPSDALNVSTDWMKNFILLTSRFSFRY